MVLAMGTGPVSAGMGYEHPLRAGRALRLQARTQRGAAGPQGGQGLQVLGQEPVTVVRQKRRCEALDQGSRASFHASPGDGEAVHPRVDPRHSVAPGVGGQPA